MAPGALGGKSVGVRGKWDDRGRLVWAVAVYKERWGCRSVWACGVGLVASGLARGTVEWVRGV
jgi:hypothetical protein